MTWACLKITRAAICSSVPVHGPVMLHVDLTMFRCLQLLKVSREVDRVLEPGELVLDFQRVTRC